MDNFDFDFGTNEIAFEYNSDNFSNEFFDVENSFNNEIHKPKKCYIKESAVMYSNAEKMANEITLNKNERVFAIINGNFIFGDFLEAFIVKNNYLINKLIVSTLSMSQNNIDSLENLITGDYVKSLDLIVSDYFYSHERNDLIKYIYKRLDINNCFQLAVASSHTKIAIFETDCGKKFVIHGSANLRSSSNIEQFQIEESEFLYDFNYKYLSNIVQEFQTINKSLRRTKLWETVNGKK